LYHFSQAPLRGFMTQVTVRPKNEGIEFGPAPLSKRQCVQGWASFADLEAPAPSRRPPVEKVQAQGPAAPSSSLSLAVARKKGRTDQGTDQRTKRPGTPPQTSTEDCREPLEARFLMAVFNAFMRWELADGCDPRSLRLLPADRCCYGLDQIGFPIRSVMGVARLPLVKHGAVVSGFGPNGWMPTASALSSQHRSARPQQPPAARALSRRCLIAWRRASNSLGRSGCACCRSATA